jgi:hypothetical protein
MSIDLDFFRQRARDELSAFTRDAVYGLVAAVFNSGGSEYEWLLSDMGDGCVTEPPPGEHAGAGCAGDAPSPSAARGHRGRRGGRRHRRRDED